MICACCLCLCFYNCAPGSLFCSTLVAGWHSGCLNTGCLTIGPCCEAQTCHHPGTHGGGSRLFIYFLVVQIQIQIQTKIQNLEHIYIFEAQTCHFQGGPVIRFILSCFSFYCCCSPISSQLFQFSTGSLFSNVCLPENNAMALLTKMRV